MPPPLYPKTAPAPQGVYKQPAKQDSRVGRLGRAEKAYPICVKGGAGTGRETWVTPMCKTTIHPPVRDRDVEAVTWQDSLHRAKVAVQGCQRSQEKRVGCSPWKYASGGYKGEILKPKLWTTVKMWKVGRIAQYLGTVALKGLSEVTAPSDSWRHTERR